MDIVFETFYGRRAGDVLYRTIGSASPGKFGFGQVAEVMDRRAARTRRALHGALMSLILRKGYEAITVRDIIDEADVARSTMPTTPARRTCCGVAFRRSARS
jgi:Bacterial regulatory proteins, tetR family